MPETLAGRDVAKALCAFMVDDARAEGVRIVPVCPFVRKMAERQRREPGSDAGALFVDDADGGAPR